MPDPLTGTLTVTEWVHRKLAELEYLDATEGGSVGVIAELCASVSSLPCYHHLPEGEVDELVDILVGMWIEDMGEGRAS